MSLGAITGLLALVLAAADPGKEEVGVLRTLLVFGTNEVRDDAKAAASSHGEALAKIKGLGFANYYQLGEDRQSVWRGYTNWAAPMKGSEEILLSFEPSGEAEKGKLRLDLELWQSRQKVMKTTQTLEKGRWLYIGGPRWRNGRLIIVTELAILHEK